MTGEPLPAYFLEFEPILREHGPQGMIETSYLRLPITVSFLFDNDSWRFDFSTGKTTPPFRTIIEPVDGSEPVIDPPEEVRSPVPTELHGRALDFELQAMLRACQYRLEASKGRTS